MGTVSLAAVSYYCCAQGVFCTVVNDIACIVRRDGNQKPARCLRVKQQIGNFTFNAGIDSAAFSGKIPVAV